MAINLNYDDEIQKLNSKFTKKVNENKILKLQLEEMCKNIDLFQSNYNKMTLLYNQISEALKNFPRNNESFTFSTHLTDVKFTRNCNCINYEAYNNILIKKIEEMEYNFNQMNKSFNNLVHKYKILNDEKNRIEDKYKKNNELINNLLNYKDEMILKDRLIERLRNFNNTLVEYCINTIILNTNENRRDSQGQNRGASYIACEPLPSILKFMYKINKDS